MRPDRGAVALGDAVFADFLPLHLHHERKLSKFRIVWNQLHESVGNEPPWPCRCPIQPLGWKIIVRRVRTYN